ARQISPHRGRAIGLRAFPDFGYISGMSPPGFIEPCLPSPADRPPSGPDWIHEIKHDGYRLMARRDPNGVRLLTRNANDRTGRFPLIFVTAAALQVRSWSATQAPAGCRPIQYVRATPVR